MSTDKNLTELLELIPEGYHVILAQQDPTQMRARGKGPWFCHVVPHGFRTRLTVGPDRPPKMTQNLPSYKAYGEDAENAISNALYVYATTNQDMVDLD